MDIQGSKTEKNLLRAFAGESQARNRYDFFAGVARKEKLILIASIFEETARQEIQHAKRFFRFLQRGGPLEITEAYPAGIIGTTLENLKHAAEGEKDEWSRLYPEFASIAREEGFAEVALAFDEISIAEKHHETRYLAMVEALESDKLFKSEQVVIWKCQNCGYIHEGLMAPEKCPACLHPQGYFQIAADAWYNQLK